MIAPHYNTDLNAWITVNAATGEWVLVFGPIKPDVADFNGEPCAYSEERMARLLSPQRAACRGRRMTVYEYTDDEIEVIEL